jgi:hypothetical protein
MFNQQPLRPTLSGLGVEYRIIQLYSRDDGQREARIAFDVGQGTQDLGFRNEIDLLFGCLPASAVTFRVQDEQGQPTTARFTVRDQGACILHRPNGCPGLRFILTYRADGEHLPPGIARRDTRGPEYLPRTRADAG